MSERLHRQQLRGQWRTLTAFPRTVTRVTGSGKARFLVTGALRAPE